MPGANLHTYARTVFRGPPQACFFYFEWLVNRFIILAPKTDFSDARSKVNFRYSIVSFRTVFLARHGRDLGGGTRGQPERRHVPGPAKPARHILRWVRELSPRDACLPDEPHDGAMWLCNSAEMAQADSAATVGVSALFRSQPRPRAPRPKMPGPNQTQLARSLARASEEDAISLCAFNTACIDSGKSKMALAQPLSF